MYLDLRDPRPWCRGRFRVIVGMRRIFTRTSNRRPISSASRSSRANPNLAETNGRRRLTVAVFHSSELVFDAELRRPFQPNPRNSPISFRADSPEQASGDFKDALGLA